MRPLIWRARHQLVVPAVGYRHRPVRDCNVHCRCVSALGDSFVNRLYPGDCPASAHSWVILGIDRPDLVRHRGRRPRLVRAREVDTVKGRNRTGVDVVKGPSSNRDQCDHVGSRSLTVGSQPRGVRTTGRETAVDLGSAPASTSVLNARMLRRQSWPVTWDRVYDTDVSAAGRFISGGSYRCVASLGGR
jgi:hypothetical protein